MHSMVINVAAFGWLTFGLGLFLGLAISFAVSLILTKT